MAISISLGRRMLKPERTAARQTPRIEAAPVRDAFVFSARVSVFQVYMPASFNKSVEALLLNLHWKHLITAGFEEIPLASPCDVHMRTRTHAGAQAHTCAPAHTRASVHPYARKHSHTHAHTHMHTHPRTQNSIQVRFSLVSVLLEIASFSCEGDPPLSGPRLEDQLQKSTECKKEFAPKHIMKKVFAGPAVANKNAPVKEVI